MGYWEGKRCLITGASSGFGRELARALARRGARVGVNGRDADRVRDTVAELNSNRSGAIAFPQDVAAPGGAEQLVAAALSALGGLDLVCHAAGRSMRGELLTTSSEEFEDLWRLNTLAAFELARSSAKALAANRGHLVLVGSLASRVAPRYLGAYPASKFPLAALAQQLRLEMGPEGLHTLLVCPGPIARADEQPRYETTGSGLPESAGRPGGGAKVSALDPRDLAEQLLAACENRRAELVLPRKSRLLFVIAQLAPTWGDRLLRKFTS